MTTGSTPWFAIRAADSFKQPQGGSSHIAARTHREIVTDLAPPIARLVAPALGAFDTAIFAKDATLEDATRFLALVDDAAAQVPATAGALVRPS